MRTKLVALCYFRNITKDEQANILVSFQENHLNIDNKNRYWDYKKQIIAKYSIDWFKVFLLILSLTILCCSIAVLSLFVMGYSTEFGVVTYVLYGLYPVQLVSIVIGLIGRKIRFQEYKYHWLILFIQVGATLASYLFVIYKLADSLSAF